MNTRNLLFIVTILLFVGSSPATAQTGPHVTAFTASETLDPWGILGNGPVGYFLSFGTLHCPGYPTPDPSGSCPEGSRNYRIGVQWVARLDSPDARFNGPMTVEANLLWDDEFLGRTWTRYSVQVDGGGTWNGQCQGRVRSAGDHTVETLNCSGRGVGGIVDRQHSNFTITVVQYPSPVIAFVAQIEGTVIAPHSN
jgi:hypothetical protein